MIIVHLSFQHGEDRLGGGLDRAHILHRVQSNVAGLIEVLERFRLPMIDRKDGSSPSPVHHPYG